MIFVKKNLQWLLILTLGIIIISGCSSDKPTIDTNNNKTDNYQSDKMLYFTIIDAITNKPIKNASIIGQQQYLI